MAAEPKTQRRHGTRTLHSATRSWLQCLLVALLLLSPPLSTTAVRAAFAPNHFLGTCLTKEWVAAMEVQLGVSSAERDHLKRHVHPFLRPALQHPRYRVEDLRTSKNGVFSAKCMTVGSKVYGVGAQVDANGEITMQGRVDGTLVVEVQPSETHAMASSLFAILASEVLGYEVSLFYTADAEDLTERMSSVGAGECTPTHVNIEVWTDGIEEKLEMFANESVAVGGIGYLGRSGLYTTANFVKDALNTTKYPGGPYFPNFWKGYEVNEPLINAVAMSKFTSNAAFYPPTESGCADGTLGCRDHCSKTAACTAREKEVVPGNNKKECVVVVMMTSYEAPGHLQAAMANLGVPAYFCFIGHDATVAYTLYAQQNKVPVLFYHYEPDLFHIEHVGLFERVYLPRPSPEKIALATDDFGENGYGNPTSNPVDVDFPSLTLAKYAASLLFNDDSGEGQADTLVSRIALTDLDINTLLHAYDAVSSVGVRNSDPGPEFQVVCQWLRENYNTWRRWLARLPLCTFDDHLLYEVTGCEHHFRTITFSWRQPDPTNASLPYNCDGEHTELPAPLTTSRSCALLLKDSSEWAEWIKTATLCDEQFYGYSVSQCDASVKRVVHYSWLLPDPTDPSKSLECDNAIVPLPADVLIDCEYVPWSSSLFKVVAALDAVVIVGILCAMYVVFVLRKAPIIKRSQFELLEVMLAGGVIVCLSVLAYAGEPSTVLCGLRPLLVSTGVTTVFGALFVKSLRVYRVFLRSAMKRGNNVTTRMMLKVLAVLYAVDAVVFSVWFGADSPKPTITLEKTNEFNGLVDRVACRSDTFIFNALLLFWKAIVLMLGLYLSFLVRNVSADFQESIWIFSASVFVILCCLVMLPLAYLVDLAAEPFYSFLAGALLLCTAVVMALMVMPKLFRLQAAAAKSNSSSALSTSVTSQVVGSFAHNIDGNEHGYGDSSDATSTLGGGELGKTSKKLNPPKAQFISSRSAKCAVVIAVVQSHK
ncbi:hypothetical protein Gpo141_00012588 [Globisporangium polare]